MLEDALEHLVKGIVDNPDEVDVRLRDNRRGPGRTLEVRVHPDDIAAVMHALDRHLSGAAPAFRCKHRLRSQAGAFRWVVAEGVAAG